MKKNLLLFSLLLVGELALALPKFQLDDKVKFAYPHKWTDEDHFYRCDNPGLVFNVSSFEKVLDTTTGFTYLYKLINYSYGVNCIVENVKEEELKLK